MPNLLARPGAGLGHFKGGSVSILWEGRGDNMAYYRESLADSSFCGVRESQVVSFIVMPVQPGYAVISVLGLLLIRFQLSSVFGVLPS